MAKLQRFKILATQCGVAPSPTRSPRTSPVIVLRRRKTTLRMLLSGRRSPRHDSLPPLPPQTPKKRETLKDLFVSSPTASFSDGSAVVSGLRLNRDGEVATSSPRAGWVGFRHRVLIRKAWRPMLVGIPENNE